MKIPNRFSITNDENEVEMFAPTLRKAIKISRKMAKAYNAESCVICNFTGVVHYIYREYIDKAVLKV